MCTEVSDSEGSKSMTWPDIFCKADLPPLGDGTRLVDNKAMEQLDELPGELDEPDDAPLLWALKAASALCLPIATEVI